MSSVNMGTSTTNSDVQPDKQTKLAKLQARKKELEVLLAAKNEELYKLCVQEVHLTGIVPPEAPLSPEPISQIRAEKTIKKTTQDKKAFDDDDIADKDDAQSIRKLRYSRQPDRSYDTEMNMRKNISHRLSTPSVSGMSTRSASSKQSRRENTASYNYNLSSSVDQSPETFSMHSSKTCPSLQFKSSQLNDSPNYLMTEVNSGPSYRQHTVTTEQINKMYYNGGQQQDTHNFSRVKETHFSSSHPDITTHYTQMSMSTQQLPQTNTNTMPLLYQYASHLKAQSQHLSSLNHGAPSHVKRKGELSRRNTLQRTQTYHLTSHSDYTHHLDNLNCNTAYSASPSDYKIDTKSYTSPNMYHIQQRNDRIAQPQHAVVKRKPSINSQYQKSPTGEPSIDYNRYSPQVNANKGMSGSHSYGNLDNVSLSGHSQHSYSMSDAKVKEKQWYETSLDSPTSSVVGQSVSRENFASLPKNIGLQRTPSLTQSHLSKFEGLPLSPSQLSNTSGSSPSAGPQSPVYRNDVPLESPKNCTVIEQGKWIPYREVSKPFEMSDFYKYSTKFRQANKQKPAVPNTIVSPQGPYQSSPNVPEQWISHNH